MKTKAEIVQIVQDAMAGGPDAIVQSLMDEGCIDPSYVADEGDMGEAKPEDMEDEGGPPDMAEDMKEYEIPKGMPLGEARGIAVKFAMRGPKGKEKGKEKDKEKGEMPFGKE